VVDIWLKRGYNTYIDTKELTMLARIEQLEQIADELFAEGRNYLGNQLLSVAESLAEELAESDGQPDELQEWESFDPDC
jgi:hypothetical protein